MNPHFKDCRLRHARSRVWSWMSLAAMQIGITFQHVQEMKPNKTMKRWHLVKPYVNLPGESQGQKFMRKLVYRIQG